MDLNRFSCISPGDGSKSLYYNDDNIIYHDSSYPNYINGVYKPCVYYCRVELMYKNLGMAWRRQYFSIWRTKYFGISIVKY